MVTNQKFIPGEDAACLTLAEAKEQLRIEAGYPEEEDLIQSYIDSAQSECENYIGRKIGRGQFIVELSAFENPFLYSRNWENDTIAKVEYYPADGSGITELDSDQYKLRSATVVDCFEIKFLSTPAIAERDDAVIITINQGWEVNKVPAPIKQAMKLLLSDAYERREDRAEIGYNTAANAKLRPYRKY